MKKEKNQINNNILMKNQYLIAISLKNDPITKQYIFSVDSEIKDNAYNSFDTLFMEIKSAFYENFGFEIEYSEIYFHTITKLN